MAPHEDDEELSDVEAPTCEPYAVLGIEKTATADEIKSAYRKAALKHHPDKAAPNKQEEAKVRFQELAFAYAVLSDPIRRKRYDVTGSTSESLQADGDFSWSDFYRSQYADIVTPDAIETFSKQYRGSDEEGDDVLAAYEKFRGKMSKVYQVVMLSNMLEDEDRFRGYIDEAIASGDVETYSAYADESAKQREERFNKARKVAEREEKEALVEADKHKKAAKKESSEDSLMAIIRGRQAERNGAFMDAFAEKWGAQEKKPKGKGKKGKKRAGEEEDEDNDMPSEEAFQAAAARLNGAKSGNDGHGRKAKKAKR
ncbi:putative J domain-containing [Hyphodiscus hymeniophilus]|uniref:J domain-containing n=1 Tax=Hyphodiscus hymeniophilus TaxID=353542 RepID=A0A9P6VJI6_9HELO|nr:putative J domain-containing [Hyphodiscus hymeniophilus]